MQHEYIASTKGEQKYNVYVDVILKQDDKSSSSLDFERAQRQQVAYVACLVVTHDPSSKIYHMFQPLQFPLLKTLLDGATQIYCMSDDYLYGHLRAAPLEKVDMPPLFPENVQLKNPFLEDLTGHPYQQFFNGQGTKTPSDFLVDESQPIQSIVVSEADQEWLKFCEKTDPKEHERAKQESLAQIADETAHREAVLTAPPNVYNKNDSEIERNHYYNVTRWGHHGSTNGANTKSDTIYFREQEMIYWRFRTRSIVHDMKTPEMDVVDLMSLNPHFLADAPLDVTNWTFGDTLAELKTNSKASTTLILASCPKKPCSRREVVMCVSKLESLVVAEASRLAFLEHVCECVYTKRQSLKFMKTTKPRYGTKRRTYLNEVTISECAPGVLRTTAHEAEM